MRREDDEPERIYGPYEHHGTWRVHIVRRGSGGKRKTIYQTFESQRLAEKFIAGARDEAQGVTVSDAIDQYLDAKVIKGNEADTIEATRSALTTMLGQYLQRPIRSIDGRGEEIYTAVQVYPEGHKRAGQPRAADTHRVWLSRSKTFGRWLVKKRLLKSNPFGEVEPQGKRVYGADKPRLGVDQSRKLRDWCLTHPSDQGAVLTLAYLELGPRASELVKRRVGDLDDRGRILDIGKTKTAAGTRRLRIPDELVSMLRALAEGKPPDAPLFASEPTRRHPEPRRWSRFAAYHHVRRVCRAAGVPELGPQAQRRTQSTLATDAGATGLMVAQHLGQAAAGADAPVVTKQHYIGWTEAKNAQVDRAMRAITGEQP